MRMIDELSQQPPGDNGHLISNDSNE
jgi:hypothetical protein